MRKNLIKVYDTIKESDDAISPTEISKRAKVSIFSVMGHLDSLEYFELIKVRKIGRFRLVEVIENERR